MITPASVAKMFDQDFKEPRNPFKVGLSQEDRKFLEKVTDDTKHIDGHYQLPLPFKENSTDLPNNKPMAIQRATWLKRKLERNEKYHNDYIKSMEDTINKQYARKVPSNSIAGPGQEWYIPHHGVYHPKKPDKVRVVFDCSARFQGTSLNSKLLQGPDLTSSLVGVLVRFRQEPVAFMGDVEAMFHQVKVPENQRNLLKFLWWPNGDLSKDLQEYQMNVHLFGAVSSPSCANFCLRRVAEDFGDEFEEESRQVINRNFYVDDCLRSEESDEKAIKRIKEVTDMCAKGGFHLTKFVSNKRSVIQSVPEQERAKDVKSLDLNHDLLPVERALGVQWGVELDAFEFRIILNDKPLTRRGILSMISSVYDPLGFAAPVILQGKKILQELCQRKADWDDEIPPEYQQRWLKWRNDLPQLEKFATNRCYKPESFGKVVSCQMHCFSDASSQGYGQVSYLRQVNDKGEISCAFLLGKARLAPIKAITVPRLEVTAAVLSVRMGASLLQELDISIEEHIYWTDSQTVIRYINNDKKRFHVFVANRVQLIRDNTNCCQWRYVEGTRNPADEGSRGLTAKEFIEKSVWVRGPDFLCKQEPEWPQWETSSSVDIPDDPEVKSTIVYTTAVEDQSSVLSRLNYFSDWHRVKKAIAWILRIMPNRIHSDTGDATVATAKRIPGVPKPLTVEEIEMAETTILKIVQEDAFKEEIDVLKRIGQEQLCNRELSRRRKTQIKQTSSLYRLDPFIGQDGLLRVGGRLTKAEEMTEEEKYPIILPKKGHITDLLIRHAHEKVAHGGRGMTMNELRRKYWVTNVNSAVRRTVTACVTCKKLRGKVGEQKMSDLPEDRMSTAPPFTYCAVDYFGPFVIKEKRKELKRYGVLFTCLSSRAVHIETANSLDTDSFINALRRCVARRGPIREMRSDQGTNFVGAQRELKLALDEMDQERIARVARRDFNADFIINWTKNPPSASHMGGVWERQIRTVRSILRALMKEYGHALDDESFRTVLAEVECIINSRPLTAISGDFKDLAPLTPNHILTMKSKVVFPPPGDFQREDVYLRKRWRRVQYLTSIFWTRWKREFLQTLQQRYKWCKTRRNLAPGDVVLLVDDQTPRNHWKLALVVQVKGDHKGLVRSATIKTSTSTYERPISKLVLLIEGDQSSIPVEEP